MITSQDLLAHSPPAAFPSTFFDSQLCAWARLLTTFYLSFSHQLNAHVSCQQRSCSSGCLVRRTQETQGWSSNSSTASTAPQASAASQTHYAATAATVSRVTELGACWWCHRSWGQGASVFAKHFCWCSWLGCHAFSALSIKLLHGVSVALRSG